MTRKALPIPERNHSQQGLGVSDRLSTEDTCPVKEQEASTQTGRQANINMTHHRHQQDR